MDQHCVAKVCVWAPEVPPLSRSWWRRHARSKQTPPGCLLSMGSRRAARGCQGRKRGCSEIEKDVPSAALHCPVPGLDNARPGDQPAPELTNGKGGLLLLLLVAVGTLDLCNRARKKTCKAPHWTENSEKKANYLGAGHLDGLVFSWRERRERGWMEGRKQTPIPLVQRWSHSHVVTQSNLGPIAPDSPTDRRLALGPGKHAACLPPNFRQMWTHPVLGFV